MQKKLHAQVHTRLLTLRHTCSMAKVDVSLMLKIGRESRRMSMWSKMPTCSKVVDALRFRTSRGPMREWGYILFKSVTSMKVEQLNLSWEMIYTWKILRVNTESGLGSFQLSQLVSKVSDAKLEALRHRL